MTGPAPSQQALSHTKAQLEAVLFVASRPVSLGALVRLIGDEKRVIREALRELQEDCAQRGVVLVEIGGGWQLRTKSEHSDLIRAFLQNKPARLSRAALETLAIVAYKQPLTRAEVEDIRGVDCGAVLRGLLERRLLRILGKKEEPGRPLLYGTSPGFLEVFGLKNLRELPTLREFVELTDEHQRMVERQAPDPEEAKAQELKEYLDEVGEQDLPVPDAESMEDYPESSVGSEPQHSEEDHLAERVPPDDASPQARAREIRAIVTSDTSDEE